MAREQTASREEKVEEEEEVKLGEGRLLWRAVQLPAVRLPVAQRQCLVMDARPPPQHSLRPGALPCPHCLQPLLLVVAAQPHASKA